MSRFWKELSRGLTKDAPPFGIALGLCPALAVTTAMENGFWMGVAVIFVLLGSEMLTSLLRHYIPERVRIPVYIVIVATFVTIVDMVMHAYLPAMHAILGIFIPLIVVNCVILGRVEAFSSKQPLYLAVADALGIGLGFMVSLMAIGAVRELLGTGNLVFRGVALLGPGLPISPAITMLLPPGAFLAMGFLLAGMNLWKVRRSQAGAGQAPAPAGAGSGPQPEGGEG